MFSDKIGKFKEIKSQFMINSLKSKFSKILFFMMPGNFLVFMILLLGFHKKLLELFLSKRVIVFCTLQCLLGLVIDLTNLKKKHVSSRLYFTPLFLFISFIVWHSK